MASLISAGAKLFGAGRSKVTLIGKDNAKNTVEVELDLVETFDVTYSNQISTHAIEKDPYLIVSKVSDHVQSDNPTVSSNCILSDNLNLLQSVGNFSNKAISAKDKLKQIIYWQKSGSVLTMEGYTVGSKAFGKVLNFLNRGIGNFNSDLIEPYYAGTVTEKIENIVLGNVTAKNTIELGNDIGLTLSLTRIQIAEAKTGNKNSQVTKSGINKKGNTPPKEVKPKAEIKKSVLKNNS